MSCGRAQYITICRGEKLIHKDVIFFFRHIIDHHPDLERLAKAKHGVDRQVRTVSAEHLGNPAGLPSGHFGDFLLQNVQILHATHHHVRELCHGRRRVPAIINIHNDSLELF